MISITILIAMGISIVIGMVVLSMVVIFKVVAVTRWR
jgi:hypothetical protein